MGYLNNQVVTIDAILTKKGRELLAKGNGSFRITQFALADDEIDYTQYNPTHPSGSSYYGEAIENMPLLEAFPDETQIMKYKLTTLPRGTVKIPIIDIGQSSVALSQTVQKIITPQTLNYLGHATVHEPAGYSFTIGDIRLFSDFRAIGNSGTYLDYAQPTFNGQATSNNTSGPTFDAQPNNPNSRLAAPINTPTLDASPTLPPEPSQTNGTNTSKTVRGSSLLMRATGINTLFSTRTSLYSTLTIVGLNSGARIQVPVTINRTSLTTTV